MAEQFSEEVLGLLDNNNQEITKIEPVNSGLVKNPDQKDQNYWRIAQDMGLSAAQGVVNAAEETLDFLDENIVMPYDTPDTLLGKVAFTDFIPRFITPTKWKDPTLNKKRQLPVFHKPQTVAGNMTESVSRFLTGFVGPNKFFKGVGLAGNIYKGTARNLSASAVADLTVFDPNEDRLSDMLVEFDSPVLNNAVTQYLASDDDDSLMEGRLKNVLEGFAIGSVAEGIFYGIKGFKKMKKTQDLEQRTKLQNETAKVIEEVQNPKIKKISKAINISKEQKLLKNIDDFDIISKKDYFAVASKTKQLVKEFRGIPASQKEKYIIQTEYLKRLNAMTVSDVNILKEFRNLGVGKALYKIAIKNAFDKGFDFASDNSISESALRVYKSLEKEGFDVIYNKNVKTVKNEGLDPQRGKQIITKDRTDPMPVVLIKRKTKDIVIKTKRLKKAALEDNTAIDINKALKVIKTSQQSAKKDSELWIKSVLNTRSFKNGEEVLKTIDDVSETMFDDVTKDFLENDVLANDVAEELATALSRDKEEVLKSTIKEGKRVKNATVRMLASKQLLQELAFDLQKASAKYLDEFGENTDKWTKEAKEEVAVRSKVIAETVYSLKEQIRGAARVTQAGRIKVSRSGGKILEVEKIANLIRDYNANPAVLAKKLKGMKAEDVINEVSKSRFQKYIEVFNSLYINSLLSGTYTHAVNFLSNSYELLLKPLEQITGGALRADLRTMRAGFSQYQGMMFTFGDSIKAVGKALKQGDAVLDPLQRTQDNLQIVNGKAVRPISGSNLGFNGKVGTAIDWIGRISELPTRLLLTSDELFKQFNYRGRLYASAIENTLELGLDVGSKEGRANIDKIFKNGFDKNGMANIKDNAIAAEALQQSRVATFTNSLEDGRYFNVGGAIQKFLQKAPYLRFLAPFVRTPTNLWRQFETRIPVYGGFTKPMRDLWRTGDRRARAEVLGRQLFGTSAALYAYHLTQSSVTAKDGNVYPKITGNGPKNFNIKKTWLNNGWQPYSIAQQNPDGTITYKQYNRMDPRFYIFGIAADINENNLNINDEGKENMMTVAVLSAMKSAVNKSYLRGISDAFELAERPTPDNLEKYFGKQIGNAIPYQALIGQGFPGITPADQDMYESRSFVDEIIKKAPFIEKTDYLEPRRDILTGEPIDKTPNAIYFNPEGGLSFSALTQGPFLVGKKVDIKDDPVTLEIARLKVGLSDPRKIVEKKVELLEYKIDGQTAYDYWMEQIGKTEIRGINLKEQLARTFNTISYQRRQEGNEEFDGGKEKTIKKVFEVYKKKAYGDMLKKYKEVDQAVKEARKERYGFLKPMRLGDVKEQAKELLPRQ